MSNIDTMLAITSANQDLFVDLNEKDAETVSGGHEVFKVSNQTGYVTIPYRVDGVRTRYPRPGQSSIWTTNGGGRITFDHDFGKSGYQGKAYNLSHLNKYAFRINTRTAYKYDVDLYRVGRLS